MIVARAPLRITLGGGGTDLPSYYGRHGGFVLSAAIDKYVYICLNRPAADRLIRLKYSQYEEVDDPAAIRHDLVRPALKTLGIHANVEIVSLADVPAGTGLGSSSTYLVALLTALQELKRERVSPATMAELAFHIEHDLAEHPVGKQDQYLAALGGITCLEISRSGRVDAAPLDLPDATVEGLLQSVMLFFTGISRDANTILEEQRKASTRRDGGVLRSLHRTKEMGLRIRDILLDGRLDDFGEVLHEHWLNKKRRSSKISDARVDRWYDAAREAGALGGKLVGAGGGGFLMLYCNGRRADVREALTVEGLREFRYGFDFDGAKVVVNF